ncbi:MAG: phosphatidylcholine/phosphatidylserine synthase [Alphaproteobacteria bacterium]|nr:MAG: phosphatidylcholine/phosphatidylserine synthase [Alphaproteobacteria bacterium]
MKFKKRVARLRQKQKEIKLRNLIPNFITLISLCLGLTAIRVSFEGLFEKAIILILIAGVMDFLDGKTARLLKVKSKLGAYLDSLVDMVSFGVAPMFVMYNFALSAHQKVGWTVCLYFSVCMALRLARFNAMIDEDAPNVERQYFFGVPAPMGGYIISIPLLLFLETEWEFLKNFSLNFVLIWGTGALMISKLPVFSFKYVQFSKQQLKILVFVFLSSLPFFYTHLYLMLGLIGVLSIASIPISFNYYKKNHNENLY